MAKRTRKQRKADRKEKRISNPRKNSVAANRAAKASGASSGGGNRKQAKERAQKRQEKILRSGEGGKKNKFDRKDIAAMREKGMSDKKLARFSSNLDRGQRTGAAQSLTGYSDATQTKGDIKKYDPSSIGNQKNQRYTGHDIKALRGQGYSKEDLGKHFSELGDDAQLGKRAQKLKDRYVQGLTKANTETQAQTDTAATTQQPTTTTVAPQPSPITQTNTVTFGSGSMPLNTPTVEIPSMVGTSGNMPSPSDFIPPVNVNPIQDNDMNQQIAQDNDIITPVYGDGNYVSNTMDNSIRQYGGDNRQFTYVSSGQGKYGGDHLETPATMATLGGFYDVDDSPSKQAKFTDLYSTLNRDAQKKYGNTSSIAQGAIYRAGMNSAVNRDNLDKRIYNREQYSRAKSDLFGMQTFGDMYGYTPPKYQMPDPQKPVKTPDFGELYDEYTDF